MDEDMISSLQKKAEQSRTQLSDLEEQLQRLEQLKSRLSRLRETNQENVLLPSATFPHVANTISNASLRNTHLVNVQHLTIEDVDDEMDANGDDTDYQVLLVYSAICLCTPTTTPTQSFLISDEQNSERSPLVGLYGTP